MKKVVLAKILAFVVVFALSGCDSADLTKAPVLERKQSRYYLTSKDDETVIKDIKAFGRNGECMVKFNIDFDLKSDDYKKYLAYLKASGLEIRSSGWDDFVKCRKTDGSIGEVAYKYAVVLKDGTCVNILSFLTIKEYNEIVSKLSETTRQSFKYKEPPLGKQLIYGNSLKFWLENCEPKNGKYEIEVKTNFGTFEYEIADR